METAFKVDNYLGLTTEDLVENIEWIAEELGDEIGVADTENRFLQLFN